MRFIIYGPGAVGGALAAGLVRAGYEVECIARGAQLDAISARGLTLVGPDGSTTYAVPAVSHPEAVAFRPDDVVVLATKSQDTVAATQALARIAPSSTAVVCAQNGVENERVVARFFSNVYAVCVAGGTANVDPGVVVTESAPQFGCLDIGRYPTGLDARALEISDAFAPAWVMANQERVMEWKYTKLLRNLVLAIQALCGVEVRHGRLYDLVRTEGEACLRAAGIAFVDDATWARARQGAPKVTRPLIDNGVGGSSWQSLARGAGSIETAYLNGEVLLLGRRYGVPTPANALLYDLAMHAATEGKAPGGMAEDELLAMLG